MIGENIKKLRVDNEMTQKELADKLFVTGQAVSRWENNEVEPSIATISLLSKIFGVPTDMLLGVETAAATATEETETVTETAVEPSGPVLAVCERCNRPIYNGDEIIRYTSGRRDHVICTDCKRRQEARILGERLEKSRSNRGKSIVWGIIIALVVFALIFFSGDTSTARIVSSIVIALMTFTFVSCWALNNNFIRDYTWEVFSWGFVSFPGVIWSFSIDGLIWLIGIKLLFMLLGLVIGIACAMLALTTAFLLSIFTYPFALYRNIHHPEKTNIKIQPIA